MQTHYRNCNICEALCGLEIKHENGKVISIKGDKNDPFSRGHICPKAVALQDFYEDENRLRYPLKKTKNGFEKITWEEAFTIVENKIKNIQEKYGHDAVATFLGNPNAHNFGNQIFLPTFLRSLKTKNRFSASSVDQLPHHVASQYMFGHTLLLPVPDIDRTEFLLIIGGNPLVSNGSMMTAPDVAKRLRAIQERGGKIVVVDPRKTETANKADEHLFIKPETDALLLLAMIHVLFEEEKTDLRHVGQKVKGLDLLENAVLPFSPERVAGITGIPAGRIRSLTLEMAAADKAIVYSRMGASTQSFGGLCLWLTNVFNIINGNFDRAGGVMFPLPAFDPVLINAKKGKPDRDDIQRSRVRQLPRYYGEFPAATMADEIETAGAGQIRALINIAGNPVLSTPNGRRLEKALAKLDFMVSIDIYMSATSRHADVILPAASGLEISQFDVAFHNLAIRNTVKYAPALFEKKGDVKDDWEILAELTERIGGKKKDGRTPEMILDFALQMGTYGPKGLSLQQLKSNPHGLDLGEMSACLEQRLQTNDGLINLAPAVYISDLNRLEQTYFRTENPSPENGYNLQLIGRRVLRQHNTWTHHSHRLSKGRNECTLLVSEEDARRVGVENGDMVTVSSRTGQVKVAARPTDEIMPGVVCLPQGYSARDRNNQPGVDKNAVSINDLTDEQRVDELTGNAALNGVWVRIDKIN